MAKQGTHYDLPIVLGLLIGMNIIPLEEVAHYLVLGELSLDGNVLPVKAVLSAAIHAAKLELGIICPLNNSKESILSGNELILVCNNYKIK